MHDTDVSPATDARQRTRQSAPRLLSITIDPRNAYIVAVEGIDAQGARHGLSSDDREILLRQSTTGGMDDLVERVFEAGIASVLDECSATPVDEKSAEAAALRRHALAPLIDRSGVRQLLEGPALERAILTTLIYHAAR